MSTYVVDWVITQAPTANIYESHILTVMAERADRDGCGVFPAVDKLARACHCSKRSIIRHIANLLERGLIAPGDPTSPGVQKYLKIRADNRPNLYDVLVPAEWYSPKMLADINEDREMAGREPLTSENRPPIGPAPESAKKKPRSDKGQKRPARRKNPPAPEASPSPAETATGGLIVTPSDTPSQAPENYSQGWERGDSESRRGVTDSHVAGGLIVTQTCKKNLSEEPVHGGGNPPPPPHPPADLTAGRADEVVTDQLAQVRNQQTARAEIGAGSAKSDDDGKSAREKVMAEVRGKFPNKVRSRVRRSAQCPVEPSRPEPATNAPAP
jgi:hypothetical protein